MQMRLPFLPPSLLPPKERLEFFNVCQWDFFRGAFSWGYGHARLLPLGQSTFGGPPSVPLMLVLGVSVQNLFFMKGAFSDSGGPWAP